MPNPSQITLTAADGQACATAVLTPRPIEPNRFSTRYLMLSPDTRPVVTSR